MYDHPDTRFMFSMVKHNEQMTLKVKIQEIKCGMKSY